MDSGLGSDEEERKKIKLAGNIGRRGERLEGRKGAVNV